MNEIRVWHTHKSFTQEEVNENKDVESQSLTRKVEEQLKIKVWVLDIWSFIIPRSAFSGFQLNTMELFHSEYRYDQVWWKFSCRVYIPNWVIPWNKDEETKESSDYVVPHQVEEPTNRRFDMGRVLHKEALTTNQALRTMLV